MSLPGTALARLPLVTLELAETLEVDHRSLLEASGFETAELDDPDARISAAKNIRLWHALLSQIDDPSLGIELGRRISADNAGLVGYAMMHAPTLGTALARLARFGRILSEDYPPELRLIGDRAELAIEPIPEQRLKLWRLADYDLAAVLNVVRELTGLELVPVEVHFPYREPAADLTQHRAFFKGRLVFDQRVMKLVFQRENMDLPIREADQQLGRYLEQHAETILEKLRPGGTITERVESQLWGEIKQGRPNLESVAAALAMSPRTLQRRLSDEGTSFSEVLDAFRRKMAQSLLEENTLAVYEIAFLLGYSEPSTFHRAFRRWTDSSPREYRAAKSS